MCIPLRQRSRRDRILMGIANFALAFGAGLPHLIHRIPGIEMDVVDALCGFLLGFSICMNFSLNRQARRRDTVATSKP
jgi:hypothetical protein